MDRSRTWKDHLIPMGLIGATGIALLVLGWRRWTHVMVDYGRELYVPWRLSLGEILYRDVAYFNGPLSPYLNGTLFRAVGPSYIGLAILNIILLTVTLWLVYRLLVDLADGLTAVIGGLLFLVIFALADLTRAGNYNFVTPYSHEMIHGSLLGLATLLVLLSYLRRPSRETLWVMGLLLGLVFLTKAEFFLAAGGAVLVGVVAGRMQGVGVPGDDVGAGFTPAREGTRPSPTPLSLPSPDPSSSQSQSPLPLVVLGLMVGFLIPPTIAWLALVLAMSPAEALRGVLGPWSYIFMGELGDLLFYRHGMGADAPGEHLQKMLIWIGFSAVLFGPPIVAARRTTPQSGARRWVALASALWAGVLTFTVAPWLDMTDLPRPLPVVLAIAVVIMGMHLLKSRDSESDGDWRSVGRLACTLYALILLVKMALHPRFHNYGFALAMPATMVVVALLVYELPARIERRGGYGPAFRLASLVFLILVAVAFALPSIQVYREKTLAFGRGSDMFKIQDRYRLMQSLLEELPDYLGPNETLLVLPEGVMLNYQLRVENPTPHINFMPPELIMFGEDKIIATLDAEPPDVIVLVKRNTEEYGFETIGSGYGEDLMAWVGAHYPIAGTIEDPELWGANFGKALILRRAQN